MRLDKQKIKDRMLSVGIMTLGELAERIDVTPEAMSRYMAGVFNPSWEKLEALCAVLECRVDDIVVYDRPKAMALAAM